MRQAAPFQTVIRDLGAYYGTPEPPELTDPLELILWENVAYLVDDERRKTSYDALRERIGTRPERILAASTEQLLDIAALGGILPEKRVGKLRTIAELAVREFEGDLCTILDLPLSKAKKALKKFPGIGEPGAEKILLFTRTHPVLALDSNGLRVLLRLGFGEEEKSYAGTYRAVRAAVSEQCRKDYPWLIRAHLLLRLHGRELCKRSVPLCEACPLSKGCRYYTTRG